MSESNFLKKVFSDDGVISEFSDDLYPFQSHGDISVMKSRFRKRLNLPDSLRFTSKFRTRHR